MAREVGRRQILQATFGAIAATSSVLEIIPFLTRSRKRTLADRERGDGAEAVGRGTHRRFSNWTRIVQQETIALLLYDMLCGDNIPRNMNCPWYIKPRTIEWFYLFIDWSPQQDPERFQHFFRISPEMFTQVCNIVREDLTSAAPASFHCLPNRYLTVERQVAIAIRRLATGDQFLGISELFGLSKSTAICVTWKFITSFSQRARGFLKWPQGGQMEDVKKTFLQRWGFPNCCGAIDMTHFLIEVPYGENPTAYYDWKHNYSVTMQAVVDLRCLFCDVLIGSPGSTQDSRLLQTSSLFHDVVYHETKLGGPRFAARNGNRIREYLLGDKGYPSYSWLVTPYPRNASVATDRWNTQHSSARMCVERAFGKLKGTWRILSRTIMKPQVLRLAPTIHACVLLHNMAILSGEEIGPPHFADFPPHPPGYDVGQGWNRERFQGGNQARDALFEEVRPFYN